ncbi:MAG: hypothetical protein KKF56_02110 [Nanoarchaeota archaeon]|nr:hypothetical protein [Nanoarchaeota archaeon]
MAGLEILNFIHDIGLIWGVGGATVMAIISAKAGKDKDVAKAAMKISPAIVKMIWIGILLLIVSGILLPSYIRWELNTQNLLIKHILVAWIVIIGVLLGLNSKKMMDFAPKGDDKPTLGFIRAKKKMKIFSIINLILWYVVVLLSVFV